MRATARVGGRQRGGDDLPRPILWSRALHPAEPLRQASLRLTHKMKKTAAGVLDIGDTRGSGRRKVDAHFGSTFMRTCMRRRGVSEERSYLCVEALGSET
jgi:hypothetical protein